MHIDLQLKLHFTHKRYPKIYPFQFSVHNIINDFSFFGKQKSDGYKFGLLYSCLTNSIFLMYKNDEVVELSINQIEKLSPILIKAMSHVAHNGKYMDAPNF